MNFHLSPDQIALQDAVRRIVTDAEKAGTHRRAFDDEKGFDRDFWQSLMALGVGGLVVRGEHGGLGLDLIEVALVAEIFGHHAVAGPFLSHTLAALAIERAGSPEQKARWLPSLATGEAIGTVAFDETDGWHPQVWSLAKEGGALTGTKTNVECPELADVMVVGLADGRLAIVAPKDGGVTSTALNAADRTRRVAHVEFAGARAELLENDKGAAQAVFDAMLVLIAADALGGALRCIEMTSDYAKTRMQFGVPIARFQGIKHRLANLVSEVEPARGLVWYAALAHQQGASDASETAAICKAHLADRFNIAARTSVELHGGIGFTWDYDLQIWVKRAMFDFAVGGTPSALRGRAMRALEAAA